MSLHERADMIEAIEQSQAQQMSQVDNFIMDLLSIDPSDKIYQSFRSGTTVGLEVSSLVAGGYGLVKGVMAFNKLAKMPGEIIRIAKSVSKNSENPLLGTRYTQKILRQMQPVLKTGQPDFHGFPRMVDNYANLGKKKINPR